MNARAAVSVNVGSAAERPDAQQRRRWHGEQWLARRVLKAFGIDVLRGLTDSDATRKERFRTVLRERDAALMVCAHDGGHNAVLFGEAFERLYGERM